MAEQVVKSSIAITESISKKMFLHSKGLRISNQIKSQVVKDGYWLGFPVFWLEEEGINVAILDGDGRYAQQNSPYELRRVDEGQYAIFEGENLFSKINLYKRPKFVEQCMDPNLIKAPDAAFAPTFNPYVQLICYNHLQIWSSITCIYFKTGNPCGFCCLSAVSNWGEDKFLGKNPEWIKKVCDGLELACEELGSGIESTGLFISCGTWPSADKGAEVHVNILNAIKERLGKLPFKHITTDVEPPISYEWLYRLAEAGLTNVLFDLEICDEGARKRVMPNAKGYRKVAEYDRAFEKALEIFGRNEGCEHPKVSTILVAGLEEDETLLEGIENLARLGIPPAIAPYYPATDSPLEKQGVPAPNPERMRNIYTRAAEILEKYNIIPESFGVCGLSEVMGKREPMVKYYQ